MTQSINNIEDQFSKAQLDLLDLFKDRMKKVADSVLSDFYCDVLNYATTDAHTNYHNFLRDEFKESFIKEIATEYAHYSWAHSIRIKLLEEYPEVLRNKIIDDLQGRIKSLEEHIEQLRNRNY